MDNVARLCAWYKRQCEGEWHEDHGVKIDTLDNPGWSLRIDLEGTALRGKTFQAHQTERSDDDWIVARKNSGVFEAFGGPLNLNEMIETFLMWADDI